VGCKKFFDNFWNVMDLATVILSYMALGLYMTRLFVVSAMTQEVNATQGNEYLRLSYVALINELYTYTVAITVFTSTLKFCKLLSFHRAFMQVQKIRVSYHAVMSVACFKLNGLCRWAPRSGFASAAWPPSLWSS
jgi:uncharacterized membrane protein